MTTIVLTEAADQARIDLLTARAFGLTALVHHRSAAAREQAVAMARSILGGIDGRLHPSCIAGSARAA